jgi:hypothetical protein
MKPRLADQRAGSFEATLYSSERHFFAYAMVRFGACREDDLGIDTCFGPLRLLAGSSGSLERTLLRRIPEPVVRFHHIIESEAVRHELAGLQLARADDLQEHRRRHGIDESCGQRDVAIPELLDWPADDRASLPDTQLGRSGHQM